jgi:hypothetical protein
MSHSPHPCVSLLHNSTAHIRCLQHLPFNNSQKTLHTCRNYEATTIGLLIHLLTRMWKPFVEPLPQITQWPYLGRLKCSYLIHFCTVALHLFYWRPIFLPTHKIWIVMLWGKPPYTKYHSQQPNLTLTIIHWFLYPFVCIFWVYTTTSTNGSHLSMSWFITQFQDVGLWRIDLYTCSVGGWMKECKQKLVPNFVLFD